VPIDLETILQCVENTKPQIEAQAFDLATEKLTQLCHDGRPASAYGRGADNKVLRSADDGGLEFQNKNQMEQYKFR
jgi:hypothetical protein